VCRCWKVSVLRLALPVVYADRSWRVYVETTRTTISLKKKSYSSGDACGLDSRALHNGLRVPKGAGKKPSNDGLKGVKTNRFFMEALNGEWKSSTARRPVLLRAFNGLDRFQLVNDFMFTFFSKSVF